MNIFEDMLPTILNSRYLRERVAKPKSREFASVILPQLDDYDFKEEYRLFPSSFSAILDRIKDHPVFHTSDATGRPQEDPHYQFQVALKRFGTEASSASGLSQISKHFGLGKGTVLLYTERVSIALMSLWKDVVSWKTTSEKREMKQRIIDKGFEVSFCD